MKINNKKLNEDIDKFMRAFAVAYCKEAEKLLTEKTRSAILEYYDASVFRDGTSNEPLYYDRTYDFERNSYRPHYGRIGDTVYGGVRISTDDMSEYKHGSYSEMDVLQLAIHGIHGNTLYRSDSPLEKVRRYSTSEGFLNKLNDAAGKAVHNKRYNYLNIII